MDIFEKRKWVEIIAVMWITWLYQPGLVATLANTEITINKTAQSAPSQSHNKWQNRALDYGFVPSRLSSLINGYLGIRQSRHCQVLVDITRLFTSLLWFQLTSSSQIYPSITSINSFIIAELQMPHSNLVTVRFHPFLFQLSRLSNRWHYLIRNGGRWPVATASTSSCVMVIL